MDNDDINIPEEYQQIQGYQQFYNEMNQDQGNQEKVINPDQQDDLIDYFLMNQDNMLDVNLDNIEKSIIQHDEPNAIYLRLSKLLNSTTEKMKIFQIQNFQQFLEKSSIDEINQCLGCFFRCHYLIEHSQLSDFVEKLPILIKIEEDQVVQLLNMLINIDKFELLFNQTIVDNFKKLLLLSIFPPDPNQNLWELLSLLLQANYSIMGKWVEANLKNFLDIFLFTLQTKHQQKNPEFQQILSKMIHFFIFILKIEPVRKTLYTQYMLHIQIYKLISPSSIQDQNNQHKSDFIELYGVSQINSLIILIKQIIKSQNVDKGFCLAIQQDLVHLIEQKKFNIVYSIILPIICDQIQETIPICLQQICDIDKLSNIRLRNLKRLEQQGINETKLKGHGKIPSYIFDEKESDDLQRAISKFYLSKQNNQQNSKPEWKKLIQLDPENPNLNFEGCFPHVQNKKNLLFVFNCFNNGFPCKFGAFVSSQLKQQQQIGNQQIFDVHLGKNLSSTSNDQSFFFFYNDFQRVHFISNFKKVVEQPQQQQQQQQPMQNPILQNQNPYFLNDTKDMVRMIFSGLEFYYDDEVIMYINFGNLDLSRFNIPLNKIPTVELGPLKEYENNPDDIFLQSSEIWELDTMEKQLQEGSIDSDLKLSNDQEADINEINNFYLKFFRLDKTGVVPIVSTIKQITDNIVLVDEKHQKIEGFGGIGTKIDQTLEENLQLKNLNYLYENEKSNNILDLIIVDERIDMEKLNISTDFSKFYQKKSKKSTDKFLIYLQENIQVFSQMIQSLKLLAINNNFQESLILFFYDLDALLLLPDFYLYLNRDSQFMKQIILLQNHFNLNNNKQSIISYHKAIQYLFKSLKRLLVDNQQKVITEMFFSQNIFEQILNKIEIYIGGLPFPQKKEVKKNPDQMEIEEEQKGGNKPEIKPVVQPNKIHKPKGVGYQDSVYSGDSIFKNLQNVKKKNNNNKNKKNKNLFGEDDWEDDDGNDKNNNENLDFLKFSTFSTLLGAEPIEKILISLIDCLLHLMDNQYFNIDKYIYERIKNSKFIRIMIYIIKLNSFIELTKKNKYFNGYLRILQVLAKHDELLDFFLSEEDGTCLLEQLQTMDEQVKFFSENFSQLNKLQLKKKQSSQGGKSKQLQENQELATETLIKNFQNTYNLIIKQLEQNEFIEIKENNENQQLIEGLQKQNSSFNYEQYYQQMLKHLCVDSYDMKEGKNLYNHSYQSSLAEGGAPPQAKVNRLIKEISDLSNNLPVYATNAIFVRYDLSRIDLMKGLIFGSADTPYAHGAFIFDIFVGNEYPNGPPKVLLATTGQKRVRFNPNLYAEGKVCLSLLGTWRGNAGENWNPNQSTILQVLVSIQAIVMSQYVYYNEPSYEREMGTEAGELKNTAYSNIVRISNIRYAMIDQIRNPTKGFEDVILKSFYLKKDMILKEVYGWLEKADDKAEYSGLVSSHNHAICEELKNGKYKSLLKNEIKTLEKELEGLRQSFGKKIQMGVQNNKKIIMHKEKQSLLFQKQNKMQSQMQNLVAQQIVNIDIIDIEDDPNLKIQKKVDFEQDKDLENLYSRMIPGLGENGMEAIKKQFESSVFIAGMNPLGIEIAKNIILSGVRRITIYDDQIVTVQDLGGQFFLSQNDIGKNRAQACLNKLSHLNYYVTCDMAPNKQNLADFIQNEKSEFSFKNYDLVILINQDFGNVLQINMYCRTLNISFINSEIYGLHSRIFTDFGNFTVIDQNDQTIQEYFIRNIDEHGNTTLVEGIKHNLQDNDIIFFKEVVEHEEEMNQDQNQKQTFNKAHFKVKIIDHSSFSIGNVDQFKKYLRNGIAVSVKMPLKVEHQPLQNFYRSTEPKYDLNMSLLFEDDQIIRRDAIYMCFDNLVQFQITEKRLPKVWNIQDLELFYNKYFSKSVRSYIERLGQITTEKTQSLLKVIIQTFFQFTLTCDSVFPPMAAIQGGIIAQEAIKSMTKKWVPINQFFIFDAIEVFPEINFISFIEKLDYSELKIQKEFENIILKVDVAKKYDRYDSIRACCGGELLNQIQRCKLFMIGVGAIGCELLKNYAMVGLGTYSEGRITITDPDIIENSNLSRQFLFREKHIRKPKSQVAASRAIQMNPDLEGHIIACLDKASDQTEHIYNDKFYQNLNIVSNALDNVQARKYIDSRCLKTRIPLLDSGTLGPKGHVQVVLPFKTETYGQQQDPVEENEIPVCTLKMFPEETIHCVEWARDKFGRMFNQKPQSLRRVIESLAKNDIKSVEDFQLRQALQLLKKKPNNFYDCIYYARKKFQKFFHIDILALLQVYPPDKKNNNGQLFWTSPKRPPQELYFDPQSQILHSDFIIACAALRAQIFSIPIPEDLKSNRSQYIIEASKMKIDKFVLKQEKLDQLQKEVEKADKNKQKQPQQNQQSDQQIIEEQEEEKNQNQPQQQEKLKTSAEYIQEIVFMLKDFFSIDNNNQNIILKKQLNSSVMPNPEEFEKDNDKNFHIDFLYSITNCRALNYKLSQMEWIQVKIKAGRIIPALATTTACIAGFQTIEIIKVLKNCQFSKFKNTFINLSLPTMVQTEPGEVLKINLGNGMEPVSIWDRWDVNITKQNETLGTFFEELYKKYNLFPNDLVQDADFIYMYDQMNVEQRKKENEKKKNTKLINLVKLQNDCDYADLIITFTTANPHSLLMTNLLNRQNGNQLVEKQYVKGTPTIRVFF